MNGIDTLDAARRGLDRMRDAETYKNDSLTLPGLELAVTYLQAQIDLLRIIDGAGAVDRALEAPPPQAFDNTEQITDMKEVQTDMFEAVDEPSTKASTAKSTRHRE